MIPGMPIPSNGIRLRRRHTTTSRLFQLSAAAARSTTRRTLILLTGRRQHTKACRKEREVVSEEQNLSPREPQKERMAKAVQLQALGPQSSYWPFALALALIIVLIGVITNW